MLCIEPYTCATDALNLQARGVDAGLLTLPPGGRWSAGYTISARAITYAEGTISPQRRRGRTENAEIGEPMDGGDARLQVKTLCSTVFVHFSRPLRVLCASVVNRSLLEATMIGVAVLGLGRIGPAHARAVSEAAGARLVAIADVDEQKRTATLAEHPGVDGVADYRDALARADVQAVLIALPHWLHAQAAIDAANAGKHILIEKPMATSVEECDAMLAAARANDVQIMIGHTQHVSPVGMAVKAALAEGRIGDLDHGHRPVEQAVQPGERARPG